MGWQCDCLVEVAAAEFVDGVVDPVADVVPYDGHIVDTAMFDPALAIGEDSQSTFRAVGEVVVDVVGVLARDLPIGRTADDEERTVTRPMIPRRFTRVAVARKRRTAVAERILTMTAQPRNLIRRIPQIWSRGWGSAWIDPTRFRANFGTGIATMVVIGVIVVVFLAIGPTRSRHCRSLRLSRPGSSNNPSEEANR